MYLPPSLRNKILEVKLKLPSTSSKSHSTFHFCRHNYLLLFLCLLFVVVNIYYISYICCIYVVLSLYVLQNYNTQQFLVVLYICNYVHLFMDFLKKIFFNIYLEHEQGKGTERHTQNLRQPSGSELLAQLNIRFWRFIHINDTGKVQFTTFILFLFTFFFIFVLIQS